MSENRKSIVNDLIIEAIKNGEHEKALEYLEKGNERDCESVRRVSFRQLSDEKRV